MRQSMKKKLIALAICAYTQMSFGTVLVPGNAAAVLTATNPNSTTLSFPQPVAAKVFDQYTGQLYVALGTGGSTSAVTPTTLGASGAFALSMVARGSQPGFVSATQPAFTGIAPAALQNGAFDFMTLSHVFGNQYPVIGAVINNPSAPNSLTATTLYVLNNGLPTPPTFQPQIIQQSATILGCNPTVGAAGTPTVGIAGLVANAEYFFVATFTDSSGFGFNDSGIAVIGYDKTTLLPEQIAAVPSDPGKKSVIVDGTIPQVKIQGTPEIVFNRVALHWNPNLEKLYIGLQLSTASSGSGVAGDGVKSIVVGQQDSNENGELTLLDFLPSSALVNGQAINIAGVKQGASGLPLSISAGAIKSMKTSTGASYLIVWGGNGTITTDPAVGGGTTGNTIYALPLVDVGDPDNTTQGVLADKNNFNPATHRFETPALNNTQLTIITDPFCLVGTGTLPLQSATPISGIGGGNKTTSSPALSIPINTIDMEVLGDTVYVAIGTPANDSDDSGVFSSQAMFDNTGKISGWSSWAKRAFPFNGFTNNPEYPDSTRFVSVDPVTNQIYAVDNNLAQTVRNTYWNNGQYLDPLPLALTSALPRGSYSVLDLDQNTRGFNPVTRYRYALFGGINSVVFAQTSQARTSPSSAQSSQKITTDYQTGSVFNNKTMLVTSLPLNAGPIKVLEYSRQLTTAGDSNYFFATGNNGLNVFADQFGNGFNVNSLNALNLPPFSTGMWQKAPAINGSVIDIKTLGSVLYVMVLQGTPQTPVYTILSIPFTTNIASMFTSGNISTLAQTGVTASGSDLSGTSIFYGMQVISGNDSGTIEQLVIATNNGLFVSTAPGGVQAATSQASALWTKQNPSNTSLFSGIAAIDTQKPTTVWPISIQDPTGQGVYNRSSLNQLSGGNDTLFGYSPTPFDPNSNSLASNTFPLIRYFWSDGGQSMAVVHNPLSERPTTSVFAIPGNLAASNLPSAPLMTFPSLLATPQIYWLKRIGATGLLLAGTNSGVIALE